MTQEKGKDGGWERRNIRMVKEGRFGGKEIVIEKKVEKKKLNRQRRNGKIHTEEFG